MTDCTHEKLVEGYYGHDCAACGVLVYPYGSEPWNDDEDYSWTEDGYDEPSCEHCGGPVDYERCGACEDGYAGHDCGEDCCACLAPEPNVRCDQCDGKGGWYQCWNSKCPGKAVPASPQAAQNGSGTQEEAALDRQ